MSETRTNQDFRLVLISFIGARLMLLAAVTPEAIITYGDYEHYFNLALLSSQGHLPFLDYWYEFPPLFPFLSIGLYQLTASSSGALHSYAYALATVMLAFDVGNLVLLYRLARRIWSERAAIQISWVYLALPVGMIYTWRTFDSMTAFWILLALNWLMEKRDDASAVALGLGVMTKFLPILLLPAVWIHRPIKKALRHTLILIAVCLLIFGPFIIASPEFGIASLKAQAGKSSWQTVWALIDGNLGTGNFGPITEHFDPELATRLLGQPERVPGWLTLLLFGGMGLYFFLRVRRAHQPDGDSPFPHAFLTLTFAIFFLWSKGWSPQWQLILFPLVLLTFPSHDGVLFCILFGLLNFLEWPILLSRGMFEWLWVTVTVRTLLLLGLAVATARQTLLANRNPSAGV